jgi:peptidyl-prolyl cis-trans isomerase SurA
MITRRFVFGALFSFSLATLPIAAENASNSTTAIDDGLNLRFANGIAAIVESKPITVDDIRREITPLIPSLQRECRNEQEFNVKLEALQDDIIQSLIDRELIVKEFYRKKDGEDEVRRIPSTYVDNRLDEIQAEDFGGDRSKFLAYLRARGITLRDYRTEVENDIIYQYMRGQQRRNQNIVSPVKIEQYYAENKDRFYQEDEAHMRLIQLNREEGESDLQLTTRATEIVNRVRNGERFDEIAKQYSKDSRRARGGDWGWQKRPDLKKEFSEPLFALKKGEVTDPILLGDNCFVLFVEERKYAGTQTIDDVRDEIERILIQQMSRQSHERWLERLRRNGYVKHY